MKVALITGSGKRRIGSHVADALAERGYAVAIHYRTSAGAAQESVNNFQARGVQASAIQADLTQEAAVRAMIDRVLQTFGRLDVLVNCAAIWEAKRLEDTTADDVRRNLETNTLGTFLCCQQAGLAMVRQPEGGCIINFGDWADARPYLHHAAYFASKGGIPALSRAFAVELGTRNPKTRVNTIMPGPVLFQPDLPAADWRAAIAATLTKREGTPQNVVQAVLYLIDNDFVTGDCLHVDGGRSIYAAGH